MAFDDQGHFGPALSYPSAHSNGANATGLPLKNTLDSLYCYGLYANRFFGATMFGQNNGYPGWHASADSRFILSTSLEYVCQMRRRIPPHATHMNVAFTYGTQGLSELRVSHQVAIDDGITPTTFTTHTTRAEEHENAINMQVQKHTGGNYVSSASWLRGQPFNRYNVAFTDTVSYSLSAFDLTAGLELTIKANATAMEDVLGLFSHAQIYMPYLYVAWWDVQQG